MFMKKQYSANDVAQNDRSGPGDKLSKKTVVRIAMQTNSSK